MWSNFYATPCENQGQLEYINYDSRAYALEAVFQKECIPMKKAMWVYTPYNYDCSKKYNVVFLMHGGTDDEGFWFGKGKYESKTMDYYTENGNITKNMLDHLIDENKIDPVIIVAPSFNEEVEPYISQPNRGFTYFANSSYFWMELRNEIMPLIQSRYSTYAKSNSDTDFAAARNHFGYIGASQGSITGLYSIMPHCLDRISYIGSLSAGSIKYEFDGKKLTVAMDEDKLGEIETALKKGPRVNYWYNGCGDADDMYQTQRETYERISKDLPDVFRENANCCFVTHKGGTHHYKYWIQDFCNALELFFPSKIN